MSLHTHTYPYILILILILNRPVPEKSTDASEKALTDTPDGEEPNLDEKASLRHVAENLPLSAWLIAFIELCERFTYYGMQGLFQNYIELPLDGSQGRGALGMGHQGATGLTTFFQFWCYGALCCVALRCLSLSLSLSRAVYKLDGVCRSADSTHQSPPFLVPLSPISISANTRPSFSSVVSTWSGC